MDGDKASDMPVQEQSMPVPDTATLPDAATAEEKQIQDENPNYADTSDLTDSNTNEAGVEAHRKTPVDITWTASEFIAHEKSAGWYVLFVLSAIIIAAIVYIIARDPVPSVAVLIGVLLLAYYASRRPQQQTYRLDASGLTIGNHHMPYHEFQSFAVLPEGAFVSIQFTPLKRFAMYTNIYVGPDDEERIISFLSDHLPMEEGQTSLTDSLMRRIHF